MTKEEFEQGYAKRSGMTVDQLHGLSFHAEFCECGEEICEGWQMVHTERCPECGRVITDEDLHRACFDSALARAGV